MDKENLRPVNEEKLRPGGFSVDINY